MARRARSSVVSRYTSKDDVEFIELSRKQFQQENTATTKQRERELADLAFYAGGEFQWDPQVLLSRAGTSSNANNGIPPTPPRPSLTIDNLRAPIRQVLNAERSAELGVEIVAVDDFGDSSSGVAPEELELREGLVRRIQRDSQAADARSWAFMRAVIAGRGFWRVMTRYSSPRSFDQDIYIDRIYNQASVSIDPAHEQPDGSDADWGFIGADIPWSRYQAEYGTLPNARKNPLLSTSASEWRALGDELPGWFSGDPETRSVRVVEKWYTERKPVELVQLQDGRAVARDELAETDQIALDDDGEEITRTEVRKSIKFAKIDGVQVLERTDWLGQYLPIIKVVGEELQPFDHERRVEGMVRPARDGQIGFNVMISKFVENVGLTPLPSWLMAAGQDEGFEEEYKLSTTRTLPAIHYNQKDLEGVPAGPPSRTNITTDVSAIGGAIQLFREAIKDTTAVPDPRLGNIDSSLRSDKAIKRVLDQATEGTSHFTDNQKRSLRYEGIVVNDLLFGIYGRKGRMAQMMSAAGETKAVPLHQHFVRHPETKKPLMILPANNGQPEQPITPQMEGAKLYTLTEHATFNVTVKVTKNYDTRRQQQESVLASLVQEDPQLMAVYGDLMWKYNDGPGHEELQERGEVMLAPAVQALLKSKKGGAAGLLEAQTQLAQLQQENAMLKQAADANQVKLAIAAHADETKLKVADINAQTQLVVAEVKAGMADLTNQVKILATMIGVEHEARLAEREGQAGIAQHLHEAQHEVGVTLMKHEQAKELAQMSRAQALELAAQAPAPETGATDAQVP